MSFHDGCVPAPAGDVSVAAEAAATEAGGPLVEILTFEGCPNHEPVIALVERVSRELGVRPEIRLVDVPDQETAQRLRFLGSPTILVRGRDVDPQATGRSDYALSCRMFQTKDGLSGQPDEHWVREALMRDTGGLLPAGRGAIAARSTEQLP